MIKYINDNDLEFLSKVKSEDLNDLVYRLTHDKDDTLMLTEELISHELYKKYYPDHHKYWQLIAAEIQRFGANTFSTLFRGGEGVKYKEVLTDVCDRLKVNYNKDSKVERIEDGLLMKILEDMVEKMSQEELKKFAEEAGFDSFKRLTPEMMIGFFQTVFLNGGFKSYQITLKIVNTVSKSLFGRGLSLVGNNVLVQGMDIITGPIGWTFAGLLTINNIAGPAYRVTVPAVTIVATLRKKYLNNYNESESEYKEAKPNDADAHNNFDVDAHNNFDADAHNNLGDLLYSQIRFYDAEKEYRKAIRIEPHYSKAHLGLGILLSRLDRFYEAEQEFREVIRIDPNYAEVRNRLKDLLNKQGKYNLDESDKEYKEAKPNDADAHNNLGDLLYSQIKFYDAEKEYRKAIRIEPHYSKAHLGLGILLSRLDRFYEAEQEFREVIRIDPNNAEARNRLKDLLNRKK